MSNTKTQRTRELLRKRWLTALDSALNGGCLALSQRVGEMRAAGLTVRDKWVTTQGGAKVKAYRLVGGR